MLYICLIFELLLMIYLLNSLKHLTKLFMKLEVLLLFIFTSFLCQHINFKIFSAYERLGVKEELIPRVWSYLHFGITLPIILMWLLYMYRTKHSIISLVLVSWVVIDLVFKQVYLLIGALQSESNHWYPIVDLCISIGILCISIIFMRNLQEVLRKEYIGVV
ncbi:hypothetical protein [Bacillus suaedaesalsae]|uniref:Uncharacterized protein n=1 Tax=Bacillus suaedaesalsae TaxID=2810349 RepID=A0ABS2DHC8_9BACI|nr:hypothetical protein [Bacillus suaedaesalsae]MBM6617873.1 hypothetical protein [Bacillus suaedaesalsae]